MTNLAPAFIAGAVALVVAAIGVGGAALGARLHKKREFEHWLRDQRLGCAVEFITSTRRLLNQYRLHGEAGMDQEERNELRGRMRNARSSIELLCSAETVAAAKKVTELLYITGPNETAERTAAAEAAFAAVVRALRSEIGAQAKVTG